MADRSARAENSARRFLDSGSRRAQLQFDLKKKQAAAITKKAIEQFRGFFVLRIAGNLECRTRT
jgi:hypothetical protein